MKSKNLSSGNLIQVPPVNQQESHPLFTKALLEEEIQNDLTAAQIARKYVVHPDNIYYYLSKFGLKTNNVTIKSTPLTDLQKSVLLGTTMGDGNLSDHTTSSMLLVMHGLDQLDYLSWKKELLGNLVRHKIHKTNEACEFWTVTHPEIREFRDNIYDTTRLKRINKFVIDRLNDLALLIWYLDDGRYQPNKKISNWCFDHHLPRMDIELFSEYLFQRDLDNRIYLDNSSKTWSVTLRQGSTKRLIELFKQFSIPDCMLYKLG